MATADQTEKIDVRAQLGNPKITFVTGAPGSGKGTQCEKLVEEFGYTHISTGDLIRSEIKKGSRDGDRLKQFVDQGKNAPLELTVQLLINALIENPSQNYLIDGFPREVDQCTYFETNVLEAQNVLFFDCSKETCIERLMSRGQGRSDDTAEAIEKRFETFVSKNLPVVTYYEQFGKVRRIDANRDSIDIYEDTRCAMLPQISCIIGPKASGKTTLGTALCKRTNMNLLNYNEFVIEQNLEDCDDEEKTTALIAHLAQEIAPRILLEDFPQSEFQAKFFTKNCVSPSRVFALECSKDLCQERMTCLAQTDSSYQPSAILSKRIRQYNENAQKLMPYLQASTNLKCVSSEQNFEQAFSQLCGCVEPTILLVRPGGTEDAYAKRSQIIEELKATQKFQELNVFSLIKEETERHTQIGQEINEQISAGKDYQRDLDHLIVKMLKKIVFSGIEGNNKFILTDFPDTIKQAQEFEKECSKLTAVIFAAGGEDSSTVIEIIDNGLSIESIDSLLQKEHRLKSMRRWDESTFNEHLGNKTEWAIVLGQSFSGKSVVAGVVNDSTCGKIIDLTKIAEDIRPKLETEDGPFEGRIPDAEVEKAIVAMISADKNKGDKFFYIVDGQHHETVNAAASFLLTNLGAPTYLINCTANEKVIQDRYKEKNEIGEELGEEDVAMLKEKAEAATADAAKYRACWADVYSRVKELNFDTACSKESMTADVRSRFSAKVILVNHEKRIEVDTACSNLAIKYNLLYLSVYQLIKQEICAETQLGRSLAASKRQKDIEFGSVAKNVDPFDEKAYSAVHYDQNLVMQLVLQKIAETRTSQRFILLEGFMNSEKLSDDQQRMQLRFMDEFFCIQRSIGQVSGCISLRNEKELTEFKVDSSMIDEPAEEEVKQVAPKAEGVEGEEPPPEEDAAAAEGEPKTVAWNPNDYTWTKTDRCARNLPQLFRDCFGTKCAFEEKNWKTYQANSHGDAAVKALDDFCEKVTDDSNSMIIYKQIIFNDLE